jgi:hypothetical protein
MVFRSLSTLSAGSAKRKKNVICGHAGIAGAGLLLSGVMKGFHWRKMISSPGINNFLRGSSPGGQGDAA